MSVTPMASSSVESSSASAPSLRELLLEKMKFTPPVSDLEPISGLAKPSYAVKPGPTTKAPLPPSDMMLVTKADAAQCRGIWEGPIVRLTIPSQAFSTESLDELLEFLLKIRHDMEVPF